MLFINKRVYIILILSFLFQNVYSQRYFTKSYDIENGLPTRMVNDICQDTSGLIWLATASGISCYDGFKFVNYNLKDRLPDQKFKRLKIDSKGILWGLPLLSSDTIVFFKNQYFKKIEQIICKDNLNQNNSFDVMYINDNPVIGVGCNNGFYLFRDNEWKHFNVSDKNEENIVLKVIANKGKFYIATLAGLCVYENDKLDWSLNSKLKSLSEKIITIEFENAGKTDEKLWVLNDYSLSCFENGDFKVMYKDLQLPKISLAENGFIKFHGDDEIFFGNGYAKYYINRINGNVMPLLNINGFSSNGAQAMFIDKEENVWFADTRGIDKFNKLYLRNYFEINGLLENEVTAAVEMNNGRFVFGHNNGLSIMDKENNFERIYFKDDILNTSRVSDLFKDSDGNVWFTANRLGTGKMTPDGRIKYYKNKGSVLSTSAQQDINGKIWIGTNNGLFYLKDDKLREYKYSSEIRTFIRKIFPCDKGGIYIVGASGLWYADDNGVKNIPATVENKVHNVFSYYKNKEGIEFIGALDGLHVIENGMIVRYNKNGINITSPIYFILQDREGTYWLGSNNGVIKWDGKAKTEVFNTSNGLAGNETNRSAGILDSKGRMWIGTDLGLSCFLPDYNKTIVHVPKIMMYDLEDNKGNQYYLDENNTVPYSYNTLLFNFRGISYVNEEMLMYKFKLEGYDKNWHEIKQPLLDKIRYVDVDPGSYRMCVMVKNSEGEWSDVKYSGKITVDSPFYRTIWFYVFIFLIFGSVIAAFVKIKDQKYQNTKLEKEIKFRKRIEQELQDSKKKYQDIVELLPEAIYETDVNGYFTFTNSYGLKLLNFTADDLKKGIKVLDVITKEDHIKLEENRNKVLENQAVNRVDYTCISKDGKKIPLSINAVPIIKDGKTTGIRGVALDMSENKKVEEALIKYAEDLKELNASKDKFFSIVAHDLRNPFQGLLGFSDFLHSDYDSLTDDEKREYIGYIRNTSRKAYNLLDNLLQWSRLQTGRIEIVPANLNLFTVINSVFELMASNAIRKKISLNNNADNRIIVIADSNMLNSILQNLISNAIKFTNLIGEVRIESELSDRYVKVSVIDNGIGMDEDEISKLFKIDENISSVGTMKETGTGLGLILCKEMIELNGGSISVKSEEDKGSMFSFTLPIVRN